MMRKNIKKSNINCKYPTEIRPSGHITLIIRTSDDFGDIVSKSPYSKLSEVERIQELDKSVEEANAALKTFSYQRKSFLIRFFEFVNISR